MIFRVKRFAVLISVGVLWAGPAPALTLEQALVAASSTDSRFQASKQQFLATQKSAEIAKAALLPQVSYNRLQGKTEFDRQFNNGVSVRDEVSSLNEQLVAVQPVLDMRAYRRYEEGKERTASAETQLQQARQDLILRVAKGYLDAVGRLQERKRAVQVYDFHTRQADLAKQTFEIGEISELDALSARAEQSAAYSRLLEAEQQLAFSLSNLQTLTGREIQALQGLPENFTAISPLQTSVDELSKRALLDNPSIHAAQHQVEIAKSQLEQNEANHYPVLDVVLSTGKVESDTVGSVNTSSDVSSASVRLNVPLFSGFRTVAEVDQSTAELRKAEHDLDFARKQVTDQLRRLYKQCVQSAQLIASYQTQVESFEAALKAAQNGYRAGLNVYLDVMRAKRDLMSANHDLQRIQLQAVQSHLDLRALTGQLTDQDLVRLSKRLSQVERVD
ncbi:MAG: TolC family outer membrane protein [Limnobacter sp.]|nr:TolC family outer membrane protein [Limnobacter sp.]